MANEIHDFIIFPFLINIFKQLSLPIFSPTFYAVQPHVLPQTGSGVLFDRETSAHVHPTKH